MNKHVLPLLYSILLSTALIACSQQESATEESSTSPTPAEPTATAEEMAAPESAPALEPALPVAENPDHEAMLASDDPQLAANKRLVYDLWRTLVDAHDTETAKQYLDEGYIQHNPIADTGREGVFAYFSSLGDPLPIQDRVQRKIVAMVAENDLVVIAFVDEQTEPRPYTTTWFDMFRIKDGKVMEHWDHGTLPEGMTPRGYVPPTVTTDQEAALASDDPRLAANKRAVYDMWRTLLEGQQLEEAPRFLAQDYIQHNPMANTGLEGFMSFFRQFAQPQEVPPKMQNLIEMVAEGDLVVLSNVATYKDANDEPYTTTWFDMFRVKDGMMVEHWDTAKLPVAAPAQTE